MLGQGIPAPQVRNEAFYVPTDVCFNASGADLQDFPCDNGIWPVLTRVMAFDYLWNEVRVKGGAYGTGFQAARSGNLRFYSYRDPHLAETLARFAEAAAWLERFDPSPEALEGFVVATVAGLDAPIKPRGLIRRQMGDYFAGYRSEDRVERREQVISTGVDDVRALGPIVAKAVAQGAVCSFGNREILEGASANLDVINLVG